MFRTSFGAVAWVMTGIGASAVLTSGMAAPSVAARGGEACRLRAELQQAEPSRCDEPVVIRCGTGDPDEQPGEAVEPVQPELVHAVEPKPLGPAARKGLAWLVERQRQDGGWNQGEGGNGGREGEEVERSNVGDTCMAALALVRSGSTPTSGPHAEALARAASFVCAQVEASDDESLWVTDVRGTRVQSKIGTYVDTFLASMLLSEVSHGSAEQERARVDAALAKVLSKIEANQRQGGGFDQEGWAPLLSESLAGKALNRASQRGFDVSLEALADTDGFFARAGELGSPTSPGTAGVLLYDGAAKLGALQESTLTSAVREKELKDELAATTDEARRDELEVALGRIADGRKAQEGMQRSVVDQLDRPEFVSGFGSNGGEEFLSYMNISESLVVRADDAWKKWDGAVGQNLARVQNEDGSWNGHHCITGRTFCTSAALLVLMADRIQFPADVLESAR
jgi:hypothetical protein